MISRSAVCVIWIISEESTTLTKAAEMSEKFEAWKDNEMNDDYHLLFFINRVESMVIIDYSESNSPA